MADSVRASGITAGLPYPLGATWDGAGSNFALFSANAAKVELCLFSPDGRRELRRIELPEHTDEVWHGYLPDAVPGTVYGYRVHGPWAPDAGHRFNPHKLLLDPYARAYAGALRWGPEVFAFRKETGDDATFDVRDSAANMPKCIVAGPAAAAQPRLQPAVPWERTVFYEAHVRGFTKLHPGVPDSLRGTYAGMGSPAVTDWIKGLGVTSVELLPVHAFINDEVLLAQGLTNYWGYNSIGFFAPDPRYSSRPEAAGAEFREMVARLHGAGLEVILDVVYNHTAEGNHLGPSLSFRGIDNASYYRLQPGEPRRYVNDTGCGNTLNLSNPRVLQMVTDSLRHWVQEMGVDGFRFDLATTLAREPQGFSQGSGFLNACRQDPVLNGVKLVAEPWDIGPGGYQVGQFPPGWAEWNDRFRDDVRRFWNGEPGKSPALAVRLSGSADLFDRRGRRPWSTVNFVTAHDGFTLRDLVSYSRKHNAANGEEDRDGTDANWSRNHGTEGETDDPAVNADRRRHMRNLLATLFLSHGTPMLLAGDEFGRTQGGNNNPYCQDNAVSWLDWDIPDWGMAQVRLVQDLIRLRRDHPVLRCGRFLTGKADAAGLKDVTWVNAAGREMGWDDWGDQGMRCFGMIADGRAQPARACPPSPDVILLVVNAAPGTVSFTVPACPGCAAWGLVLDTDAPDRDDVQRFAVGEACEVTGCSLLLFALQPE